MDELIMDKITKAKKDTYIMFYVNECPFCQKALNLLREKNASYKGYTIYSIKGGMKKLLDVLGRNSNLLHFDESHTTKPIIFLNGRYLGGYEELWKHLNPASAFNPLKNF